MPQKAKSCPICKSNYFTVFYDGTSDKIDENYSPAVSLKEKGPIVKCASCNTVFKYNFPSEDIVKEGYEESVDTNYLKLLTEREETFKGLLKYIEKYKKPARILDIGCAEGTLVKLAKENGWDADGIEPNKNFVNWAKDNFNLNLIQGSIPTSKLEENSYDVITLLDVIEHVPDPDAFLKTCVRYLKKGGIIFISTPDISSLPSRVMRKNWFYILNIHLFYFSKETLLPIFRSSGLNLLKRKNYVLRNTLSYFVEKALNYIKLPKKFAEVIKNSKLSNVKIKYWLGQSLFICQKY